MIRRANSLKMFTIIHVLQISMQYLQLGRKYNANTTPTEAEKNPVH